MLDRANDPPAWTIVHHQRERRRTNVEQQWYVQRKRDWWTDEPLNRTVETISLYLSSQIMMHTMTKYDKREQLPYMPLLLPVALSFLSLPSSSCFSPVDFSPSHGLRPRNRGHRDSRIPVRWLIVNDRTDPNRFHNFVNDGYSRITIKVKKTCMLW